MVTEHSLQFDEAMLRKYDVSGPRYTSYPTAPQFTPAFDEAAYRAAARASNEPPIPKPLSIYAHIPFCRTVCFYCGCNKIITGNYARAEDYLTYLEREIRSQSALFDRDRTVEQLHLGGGTPTYLSDSDLERLMLALETSFRLERGRHREFSVEIDPRTVGPERIHTLARLGFNRISLGVQDFDPDVQRAVNRIQTVEQTAEVLAAARRHGFVSTNLDLIYGLPLQTLASFDRTLDTILELRPERLAVYNYAHLPQLFKVQRQIRAEDLPSAEQKLQLLELTIRRLSEAGYVYIGMDHFALPDDELALAQREGSLHRNFQGYSTRADCDLVGLGLTAIGKVGETYSQNQKDMAPYCTAVAEGHVPIARGIKLDRDDVIRREVINALMCQSEVRASDLRDRYGLEFSAYFARELATLVPMAEDGLVEIDDTGVRVLPRGRLLLRNVAMAFDGYLKQSPDNLVRFSRTV